MRQIWANGKLLEIKGYNQYAFKYLELVITPVIFY